MTLPFGSSDGLYYVRVQRAVQSEVLKAAQGNAIVVGDRPQALANTGADRSPFEVALNLAQSATRGEKRANDRPMIRVQARLLECRITLPFGSSEGLYYVQVQRAVQGEVLKAAQGNATINNGDVRLDVELDLSNLSAGGYSLSYRHAGESWHSRTNCDHEPGKLEDHRLSIKRKRTPLAVWTSV